MSCTLTSKVITRNSFNDELAESRLRVSFNNIKRGRSFRIGWYEHIVIDDDVDDDDVVIDDVTKRTSLYCRGRFVVVRSESVPGTV